MECRGITNHGYCQEAGRTGCQKTIAERPLWFPTCQRDRVRAAPWERLRPPVCSCMAACIHSLANTSNRVRNSREFCWPASRMQSRAKSSKSGSGFIVLQAPVSPESSVGRPSSRAGYGRTTVGGIPDVVSNGAVGELWAIDSGTWTPRTSLTDTPAFAMLPRKPAAFSELCTARRSRSVSADSLKT
jgi:hypothetical protein